MDTTHLQQAFAQSKRNGFLSGHGRANLDPWRFKGGAVGRSPATVRLSRAREIVEAFTKSGESFHSARETTAWVIVQFCIEQKIEYNYQLPENHKSGMRLFAISKEQDHGSRTETLPHTEPCLAAG